MSAFTDELTLTHVNVNWRLWRLEHDLVYEVGSLGSGREIRVPMGFLTDGASVPRLLWPAYPSWGQYARAAVVHDYLLWRLHSGDPHPEGTTRRRCDGVFAEAMGVCGVGTLRRAVLYAGVRFGALLPGTNIVDRAN